MDLRGRTAIITGASRGFGRAYAEALARDGAAVALVARSAGEIETVASSLGAGGLRAAAVPCDVSDPKEVDRGLEDAVKAFGPIDILVNSAGLGTPIGPFSESDPVEWWRTMEVNLRGPALWCRAVLPSMIARNCGRIINVASGAGTFAIAHMSAYITSKTALIRLTELIALELQSVCANNVRVFAIEPGTARTAMAEEALTSDAGRKWMPWFAGIFARGEDVDPEDSARFVLRLARGEADALSGRFLTIRDDLDSLAKSANEIRDRDALVLRLKT